MPLPSTATHVVALFMIVDGSTAQCTNACSYANNGACGDGGAGAEYSSCAFGTDCATARA